MHESNKDTPNPIEESPEVRLLKEELSKADGTLIPLHKTTSNGRKLYIAARHLQNPWEYYEVDTAPGYYDIDRRIRADADTSALNQQFYGWEEDRMKEGTPRMTGVMLVNVYTEENGKIIPTGHMDWWIRDDYANGGGNMHQATRPRNQNEEDSRTTWQGNTAFKVDPDFQRQGLGSLMLAASGTVLEAIGIKKFFCGALLEPAKKTYSKFGLQESDFENARGILDWNLPIERLSKNPVTVQTLSDFTS